MYTSEMAVKEINQYYARRGSRAPSIKNFANIGGFADQMKRAMASGAVTRTEQTQKNTSVSQEASSASKEDAKQKDKDFCCDTCLETSQLAMQLWRRLYLQNGLGSFSTGAGALTAYQNLKNVLGSGIL